MTLTHISLFAGVDGFGLTPFTNFHRAVTDSPEFHSSYLAHLCKSVTVRAEEYAVTKHVLAAIASRFNMMTVTGSLIPPTSHTLIAIQPFHRLRPCAFVGIFSAGRKYVSLAFIPGDWRTVTLKSSLACFQLRFRSRLLDMVHIGVLARTPTFVFIKNQGSTPTSARDLFSGDHVNSLISTKTLYHTIYKRGML